MSFLLNALPIFVAFFVPIFFLPLTSEFFEFNKLALVTVSTILMIAVWIVKMIKEKKVEVTKSPLDLAVGLFAAVLLLATIFSLNKHASIFGGNGRWFPSLFGFVALAAFYYVSTANISSLKTVRAVINGVLAGITLSSVVALVGYFGLRLGSAAYFQIPNFTLTGSSATAGVLAALAAVLALNKILSSQKETLKFVMVGLFALNVFAVMLLGTAAAWATLGIGLLATAYLAKHDSLVKNKIHLGASFLATIIMAFV